MANYKSQYTGAQIDEAVGKALARVGGYEETKVTKLADFVIPAGEVSIDLEPTFQIEHNKNYFVTIDGFTFELDCYGNEGENFLGDPNLDRQPFFYLAQQRAGLTYYINAYDPHGETYTIDRHIVIVTRENVTHTIEPKFLPGVCLPMLDIGDFTGDVTDESTIQFLNAVGESAMPFLLKYHCEQNSGEIRYRIAIMYGHIAYGSIDYQSVNSQDMAYVEKKSNGVWNIYVSSGA